MPPLWRDLQDQIRVRRLWNKNKYATPPPPKQPSISPPPELPAAFYTFVMPKDCDIFHLTGKLAGDIIWVWLRSPSPASQARHTDREASLPPEQRIYLSSSTSLLHIPPRHYGGCDPEPAAGQTPAPETDTIVKNNCSP